MPSGIFGEEVLSLWASLILFIKPEFLYVPNTEAFSDGWGDLFSMLSNSLDSESSLELQQFFLFLIYGKYLQALGVQTALALIIYLKKGKR